MKPVITKILAVMISTSLVGCSNMGMSQNEGIGVATGAVAGGLLGSAFGSGTGKVVAIGVGAIAGALIGGSIGKNMDESDYAKTTQALNTNKPYYWTNPKTGIQYTVVPSHWVTVNGNPHCRNYSLTGYVNGQKERTYNTACQYSDGTWRNVKTS
jgi:surface antigen